MYSATISQQLASRLMQPKSIPDRHPEAKVQNQSSLLPASRQGRLSARHPGSALSDLSLHQRFPVAESGAEKKLTNF